MVVFHCGNVGKKRAGELLSSVIQSNILHHLNLMNNIFK